MAKKSAAKGKASTLPADNDGRLQGPSQRDVPTTKLKLSALVKNGDHITIDAEKREWTLAFQFAELNKRKKSWKKPAPCYTRGVLAKNVAHVTSASLGTVEDANLKL